VVAVLALWERASVYRSEGGGVEAVRVAAGGASMLVVVCVEEAACLLASSFVFFASASTYLLFCLFLHLTRRAPL
jgi:hypothetical protein